MASMDSDVNNARHAALPTRSELLRSFMTNVMRSNTLRFWSEVRTFKTLFESLQRLVRDVFGKYFEVNSPFALDGITDEARDAMREKLFGKRSATLLHSDVFDAVRALLLGSLERELAGGLAHVDPPVVAAAAGASAGSAAAALASPSGAVASSAPSSSSAPSASAALKKKPSSRRDPARRRHSTEVFSFSDVEDEEPIRSEQKKASDISSALSSWYGDDWGKQMKKHRKAQQKAQREQQESQPEPSEYPFPGIPLREVPPPSSSSSSSLPFAPVANSSLAGASPSATASQQQFSGGFAVASNVAASLSPRSTSISPPRVAAHSSSPSLGPSGSAAGLVAGSSPSSSSLQASNPASSGPAFPGIRLFDQNEPPWTKTSGVIAPGNAHSPPSNAALRSVNLNQVGSSASSAAPQSNASTGSPTLSPTSQQQQQQSQSQSQSQQQSASSSTSSPPQQQSRRTESFARHLSPPKKDP